jgi:hypothetical protein
MGVGIARFVLHGRAIAPQGDRRHSPHCLTQSPQDLASSFILLRLFYRFAEKSAPSVGEALVLRSATFYLACLHDELA